MRKLEMMAARRAVLRTLVSAAVLVPLGRGAFAQSAVIGNILGTASDHALDKLAQPGAFYNDTAVRIGLPGIGNRGGGTDLLGSAMGMLEGVSGLDGITRRINDAAGNAAHAAKPVFRAAIGRLSLADVPEIVTHSDGGTQYLRKSAGNALHDQVRPLIDSALEAIGAYREVDRLSARGGLLADLGLSRDTLGNSVTGQALNGIFKYMGVEEGHLRANPLGAVQGAEKLLEGINF